MCHVFDTNLISNRPFEEMLEKKQKKKGRERERERAQFCRFTQIEFRVTS